MVTDQFIISLGDRNIHLSTARWGGYSCTLDTGTHVEDGTILTLQLLCEHHLSPEKLPDFGRGVLASLGCVLSGWQFHPAGNFLGKELSLKLSSHKCQEMVCSPAWIMVSGQLIHGHESSIRQVMVFYKKVFFTKEINKAQKNPKILERPGEQPRFVQTYTFKPPSLGEVISHTEKISLLSH